MRALFFLVFVVNVALSVASYVILPGRVAMHFGFGGMPDNWASSQVNMVMMLALDAFLFVMIYFSPQLLSVFPAWCINLPNKEYWLTPENLPRTKQMMSSMIYEFGAAVFLLLFVVGVIALHANLSKPVRFHEEYFWPVFVAFIAYTVIWIVRLNRVFRVPAASIYAAKL